MGKNTAEEGDNANSSHIRTFLRIRPSKRPSGYIKVDEYDRTRLGFHVPVETKDGEVSEECRGWVNGELVLGSCVSYGSQ